MKFWQVYIKRHIIYTLKENNVRMSQSGNQAKFTKDDRKKTEKDLMKFYMNQIKLKYAPKQT